MRKSKLFVLIAATMFFAVILTSCGGGLSGTYIAKNETAKSMPLTKLVFNGGTVKVYMGMPSVAGMPQMDMGTAIEIRYKLVGDKVILEGGIPGIDGVSLEFQYNKDCNEISLLKGMFGGGLDEYAPVWGKEGSFDPNAKQTETPAIPSKDENQTVPEESKKEETATADNNNSFPYQPYVFSQELAEKCALYMKDAYKMSSILQDLKNDGYTAFEYCHNTDEDGIGYALAYKKVNDNETLLAVAVRGTIATEWFGNMDIGNGVLLYHESFRQAADELEEGINKYINNNKLTNINFLITGHSRGGAVANILAADLDNENFKVSGKKKVFAYCFATPNYCKDLANDGYNYNNIFNFCFTDDFVTQVPLEKWGYGKRGRTYWAVADGLNVTNIDFKNKGKFFNFQAVKDLLSEIIQLASSIDDYNNGKLYMGPLDKPTHISLHDFMRNYVAQATIDNDNGKTLTNSTAIAGLGAKAKLSVGNDVHKIADFFVDVENMCAEQYIWDTHLQDTYRDALIFNGFLTK